jgi:hypothetical protein
MPLQAVIGVGCPNFILVPVPSVYNWDPPELQLAAQFLRWVSVKGPHEEFGVRQKFGLKRLLLCVRCLHGYGNKDVNQNLVNGLQQKGAPYISQ